MTRAEIIAELRRSAREDERPWIGMHDDAFEASRAFWNMSDRTPNRYADRTAILLISCALEDE